VKKHHIPELTASAIGLIAVCVIVIVAWEIFPGAKSRTLASQDQVSAAELSAAVERQREAAAKLTRSATFDQRLQKLSDTAQKKGIVPVIVKVRAAFKPEGQISGVTQRLAQRRVIEEAQDRLLAELRYAPSSLKKYDDIPFVALSVDSYGLAQLQSSADVLSVTADTTMKLATAESLPQVRATKAWAGGYTGAGKTVVVLDSGVDKTHPALSNKVVAEACFSTIDEVAEYSTLCPNNATASTEPDSGRNCSQVSGLDGCDHGTHIAGIAAGNSIETSGVAVNAKIISIQVMSYVTSPEECGFGTCLRSRTTDVMAALKHVYDNLRTSHSIAAVNISLVTDVTGRFTTDCDEEEGAPLKARIDQLKSVGIPTVVAAGNDGFIDALGYPACISSAVSVGAVGDGSGAIPADTVWQNSNSASYLNLLAPGVEITSAVPGDGLGNGVGTSQAAAHVSGAMALLRQASPIGTNNTVWFDDALPAGAIPYPDDTAGGGVTESWNWVSANPTPYTGTTSHQSSVATGIRQHFFYGATSTLQIGTGEILYAWARLDSAAMPSGIMLQWHDGVNWDHRAYWGANDIPWGQDGTPARINMGRLPQADGWVKLVVPARAVGLEGKTVNGMAFTQHGGRVTWDHAGKGSASVDDLLTLLKSTGVSVTDARLGAGNRSVPRIKVDAALGVNVPDQDWLGAYYNNPNLDGNPILTKNDGNGFIDRYFNPGVSPEPGILGAENYSIRWSRTITFTPGTYRFSVTGDDGVRLYIDGQLEIDEWRNQTATTYNVDVPLSAGNHEIRLEYYQFNGPAQARLNWAPVSGLCLQGVSNIRWKGEYYNNVNLAGNSVAVKDDGGTDSLNFNWGAGPPNTGCNLTVFADYFSARWTRTVNFAAGPHRFSVTGDDGVRLWVGGQLRIDKWFLQPPTTYTADVDLFAGNHEVKLEYYEGGGPGMVLLSWTPLLTAPSNLVATAVSASQIDLSWVDNSSVEDGFKIERWTGSGYSNIATVGANVRTYSDFGLTPISTYYYRVRAYKGPWDSGYSNESGATTFCTYAISPFNASFGPDGGPGSISISAAAGCSWSAVSNDWWINAGGSGSGNGVVSYWVNNYTEPYGFRGGSITVGGQLFSIGQSGPPLQCDLAPEICGPGYHWDFSLCQCVSNSVGSSSPTNSTGGVNSATDVEPRGLTARYFGNATLGGQPALDRIDPAVNFNWAGNGPDKLLPADRFSVRWRGQLAAPTSEAYTFYLYSDGGARLWVNNQLVIDRWQSQSEPHTRSAPVELKAGEKAEVRVEYYNARGKAAIHLVWSSASTRKQIIPQRYLFPEAGANKSAPADTNQQEGRQTGMLLPPGSDAGPKSTRPRLSVTSQWLAIPLGRAGLVLLIACGVLFLLLRISRRQARRRFATVAAAVVSRLRDQIAARLGELFRIQASTFALQSAAASAQQELIAVDVVSLEWDPEPDPGSRATRFRNAVGNPRFGAHLGSSNLDISQFR